MNRPHDRPRRRVGAALLALAAMPLALGAWRAECVPGLVRHARLFAPEPGLSWLRDDRWRDEAPDPAPRALVLLVHGLDEPGGIWDQAAPAIADAGHAVARLDYPNDQPAARSADLLAGALAELRAMGVERVQVVAHSMGGLIARDALTRPDAPPAPAVPLLITLGTPHAGSPWAAWQPVAEAREQVQRLLESEDRALARLFGAGHDGLGEAALDLLPGSAFLTGLNARAWPDATRVVCVVAVVSSAPLPPGPVAPADAPALPEFARRVGDGVVPADSAVMPGADEALFVHANHRSMVRSIEIGDWLRARLGAAPPPPPPAIPLILDRLAPPPSPARP